MTRLIYFKHDKYKRKMRLGLKRLYRNFLGGSKNFGSCIRCEDSWSWKSHHEIRVDLTEFGMNQAGVTPICEECFAEIETDEKMFWVRKLELEWIYFGCFDSFHQRVIEQVLKKLREEREKPLCASNPDCENCEIDVDCGGVKT